MENYNQMHIFTILALKLGARLSKQWSRVPSSDNVSVKSNVFKSKMWSFKLLEMLSFFQGWEFAHSLICSFAHRSFAHGSFAHSLISLKSNE